MSGEITFVSRKVAAGTPIPGMRLFQKAQSEFIELAVMDKSAWIQHTMAWLSALERYEIGVLLDGEPIGGLCLCADDDPHVGACCTVVSNYVLPEYRNHSVGLRCFREAIRVARKAGFTMLAYTHREKDWVYRTLYRRLT